MWAIDWKASKTAESVYGESLLLPTTRGRLASPMSFKLRWGQFSCNDIFFFNETSLFLLHIFAYTDVFLLRRGTLEMSTKRSLIKSCLGSIRLLAVCLMRLWLWPLKPPAPASQPLLLSLQGKGVGGGGALWDTVERVTRVLTTGVTRDSLHFTEVQESHKASGGIYEGGGAAAGGMLLIAITVNLEKWRQQRVHRCASFFLKNKTKKILVAMHLGAKVTLFSNLGHSQRVVSGQYRRRMLMFSFLSHF